MFDLFLCYSSFCWPIFLKRMTWINQCMSHVKSSKFGLSVIWCIKLKSISKCRISEILIFSFNFRFSIWIKTISLFHFKLLIIWKRNVGSIVWLYCYIWRIWVWIWSVMIIWFIIKSQFLRSLKITEIILSWFIALIKNWWFWFSSFRSIWYFLWSQVLIQIKFHPILLSSMFFINNFLLQLNVIIVANVSWKFKRCHFWWRIN